MKLEVSTESYTNAISILQGLLGSEADCILHLADGKARLEASNSEAYVQLPLEVISSDGEGYVCTRAEYLSAIKPRTKTLTLVYERGDVLNVTMGRARGKISTLSEDDIDIDRPEEKVSIECAIPAKLLIFSTGATVFKPLLDAATPSTIIEVEDKHINVSAYDDFMGTHYGTMNEEIRTKNPFQLVISMDIWRGIVTKVLPDGMVRLGADERYFRLKTDRFDLYHAVVQEEPQNVKEVITNLSSGDDRLAVVEFDGNAATGAIDECKGIIRSADKDGARFLVTINPDGLCTLSAESSAGEFASDFDVDVQMDSEEPVEFRVSSESFQDILKLTRDEALKYGPARLTIFPQHFIMESRKVPASSISPVLQD